jgi:hypothetical protein
VWQKDVLVRGPLVWSGYVIPCEEGPCPSGQWTLQVRQDAWVEGLDATLICPNAHRSHHPLIYPELVLRLVSRPDLLKTAGCDPEMGWVPHVMTVRDHPLAPHSDYPSAVRRWTRWWPSRYQQAGYSAWWQKRWPDLWAIAAAEAS